MPEDLRTQGETWNTPRLIASFLIALLLAEAIWSFLVSLTTNLFLPLLAGFMGGGPSSPLYLGKSAINIPALFSSFLELCLAGIVAVIVNSWSHRGRKAAVRVVPSAARSPQPKPAPQPAPARPVEPPTLTPAQKSVAATPQPAAAQQAPPPKEPTKPSKEKPKEVYYNIVGEPITPEDDK